MLGLMTVDTELICPLQFSFLSVFSHQDIEL